MQPSSCSIAMLVLTAIACTPTAVAKPPELGPRTKNAAIWKHEPEIMNFTSHEVASGDREHLYEQSQYSFQIQLQYQLLGSRLEIVEDGTVIDRYDTSQGPPPVDRSVFSTDIICVRYAEAESQSSPFVSQEIRDSFYVARSSSSCPVGEMALVLTISLGRRGGAPTPGAIYKYTISELGAEGTSASRELSARYVPPHECKVEYVDVEPATAEAQRLATAEYSVSRCHRAVIMLGDSRKLDSIAPEYAHDFIGTLRFQVPRSVETSLKVTGVSAVGQYSQMTAKVRAEPCSVSTSHPLCNVDCAQFPNDIRCPLDCAIQPNDPRCQTACPRTDLNPSGSLITWSVGMYCGSFGHVFDAAVTGCTFAEAVRAYPPGEGCTYDKTPEQPVGTCPGGVPRESYRMCLRCMGGNGAEMFEDVLVRDRCSLQDAMNYALETRKPRVCYFHTSDLCPK